MNNTDMNNNKVKTTSPVTIAIICGVLSLFTIGVIALYAFIIHEAVNHKVFDKNTYNEISPSADRELENFDYNQSKFKNLQGTNNGYYLKKALDDIATYNRTTYKSVVTVSYKDISSTNETDIFKIKSSLNDKNDYHVVANYDSYENVDEITIKDM